MNRFPPFRPLLFLAAALLAAAAPAQTHRWLLMDLNRLPSEDVVTLLRDDLDNRYFATRRGLTVEDRHGNYRIFTRANTNGSLGSDSLTSLGIDRFRDLWIGTDGGGVSVYSNGSWQRHTRGNTREGLPHDGVLALAIHKEERWIGTRNGFAVLRGGAWTTWTGEKIAGRLPSPVVTALAVDSSGDKWIGTLGGLVRLSGSVWTRFPADALTGGPPHDAITSLAVDPANRLWVGTQAGLARRDRNGEWRRFGGSEGLRHLDGERVSAVTVGPTGEVWAAVRGGAARYDGERWELYTRDNVPGLLTLFVNRVLPGPPGTFWIATQKGVIARVPVSATDTVR